VPVRRPKVARVTDPAREGQSGRPFERGTPSSLPVVIQPFAIQRAPAPRGLGFLFSGAGCAGNIPKWHMQNRNRHWAGRRCVEWLETSCIVEPADYSKSDYAKSECAASKGSPRQRGEQERNGDPQRAAATTVLARTLRQRRSSRCRPQVAGRQRCAVWRTHTSRVTAWTNGQPWGRRPYGAPNAGCESASGPAYRVP
jgi:hypothetical protein